uniref:limulus clotting factor C n=1 Tax=Glossina morsitans morsitans TaxID=37546 RepID=A0A1B0FEG8_GLOMM
MELEKNILRTLLIYYLHLEFEIIRAAESCQLPSYEQGVCVPSNHCKFITDLFEKYQDQIPSHYVSYIIRSKCSMDTEPIRVCCKTELNLNKPEPEQVAASVEPALLKTVGKFVEDTDYNRDYVSQLNTEGLNILNNLNCGDSNSNRILGGEETNLNEFPWMALLRYDSPSNEFKCGGSLITNFYVLTAAHCAKTPDPIIGVRLGEHDLSNDFDCEQRGTKEFCAPPVENFGVDHIILHPKYTVRSTSNDVALVKLDRKVEFKTHIKPICLPATQRSIEVNVNEKIFVAGWGATEAGSQSSLLLKAFVQQYNDSVCRNAFKIELSEKHICAGDVENGHDTCKGDSGGPLFQLNAYKRFKKFIQYGIVAAGEQTCVTPSYEDGHCVSYKERQFVNDLYAKYADNIPQYLLDYLIRSKCSTGNEPVRLCCKVEQVVISIKPASPSKSRDVDDLNYSLDYISQLNAQGLKILSNVRCGYAGSNFLAGGNETKLNEYPWMALLKYDGEQFKCGGTLITNNHILTAAHCVLAATDPVIGVRLGEHDITKEIDCQQGIKTKCAPPPEDFGIKKIIVHPKYNFRKRINDIALIQLDRPAQFKKEINPICLPMTSNALNVDYNDRFLVAGWGTTETGSQSNVLLKAFLKISKLSRCANEFRLDVNLKHICAGDLETGRDTCKGDSGGPLFQLAPYQDSKKRFIQYGIVSFGGVACDLTKLLPGLYTNVITFMPWITTNIV